MHSAPRALTKDPTVKFVVVQISLILLLWGDTSCWAEPLSVNSVPLNVDIGTQIAGSGGDLVYRGGVELSSEDPRFGGFSGLLVTHNGNKLLAISDRGWWLQGDLFYNESGDLVGVQHVEILPMRPLEAGPNFTLDAEAVVQTGDGELVVAYERQHRLWSYSDVWSGPKPINMGKALSKLPFNLGIESLVFMAPGEFLAITESRAEGQNFAAFYRTKSGLSLVKYPYDSYFRPSDAVRIAESKLLVLERGYNKEVGVGARLVLAQLLRHDGHFEITGNVLVNLRWPIPLDNFEGLAIVQSPSVANTIYLLSDDNYSKDQRTLLLMFEFRRWH